jgi:hypothetical protein
MSWARTCLGELAGSVTAAVPGTEEEWGVGRQEQRSEG